MEQPAALTAWIRYIVETWWNGGPDYDARIAYFASRSLLRGFRIVVATCALLLGAASTALIVTESNREIDTMIRVGGGAVAVCWLTRWLVGSTPSSRTATTFVLSSSLSIFAVSATDTTAAAGALGVSTLVLTATFAAFMLPPRVLAVHGVLALAAILYFVPPLWAEAGPVLAIIKVVMLTLTVVGVPTAVQIGLAFLTQDAAFSDTDQLCGTLNRRGFLTQAERVIGREQHRQGSVLPVGVLLLDHDDFKGINDRFGHACGDAALIATANLLRTATRGTSAVVGRMGGDEFAILLPSATQRYTLDLAETIRQLAQVEAGTVDSRRSTVSIGACHETLTGPASTSIPVERLLDHADEAMYEAKRTGNAVVLWTYTRQ